jgi:transposase InsO family protein
VTSVHVLNETVLPFFEAHEARVYTILSDNGREFYGRPDHHPYELFLQLEGIEPRTTKVRRPQSNGFIERLHRTLLMNTSVSKGEQPGMSRWSRCRQTWTAIWNTTTTSGHIRAG